MKKNKRVGLGQILVIAILVVFVSLIKLMLVHNKDINAKNNDLSMYVDKVCDIEIKNYIESSDGYVDTVDMLGKSSIESEKFNINLRVKNGCEDSVLKKLKNNHNIYVMKTYELEELATKLSDEKQGKIKQVLSGYELALPCNEEKGIKSAKIIVVECVDGTIMLNAWSD